MWAFASSDTALLFAPWTVVAHPVPNLGGHQLLLVLSQAEDCFVVELLETQATPQRWTQHREDLCGFGAQTLTMEAARGGCKPSIEFRRQATQLVKRETSEYLNLRADAWLHHVDLVCRGLLQHSEPGENGPHAAPRPHGPHAARVTASRTLPTAPELIWERLTVSSSPPLLQHLRTIRLTPGPYRVGAWIAQIKQQEDRLNARVVQIVDFEPARLLSQQVLTDPRRNQTEWQLAPSPDGTLVTITSHGTVPLPDPEVGLDLLQRHVNAGFADPQD